METLKIRMRVIDALLGREAKKRFGSSMLGLLSAFVEPLVQVAFFGLIFYAAGKEGPHGVNVLAFMITGVMPFHLFSKMFIRSMGALDANKTLLSYPIIAPIDTIVARAYLEALIYVVTYVLLMLLCFYLKLIPDIARIGYVLLGLFLAMALGLATGILTASLLALTGMVKTVAPIVNRVLFLTSGVFFSASMIPQFAREVFLYNPMFNISEIIRHGTFSNFPDAHFSIQYVAITALILMTIALNMLRYVENSPLAKVRGSQ